MPDTRLTRRARAAARGRSAQPKACGDRSVDRPGLALGYTAVECHRVAGGTGDGQLGGQVRRHDDVLQG